MFYLTLMNSLAFFAPSFFMFTVHIAMKAFREDVLNRYINVDAKILNFFVFTMDFILALLILAIVFYSLQFKNNTLNFKKVAYISSTLFGVFMLIVMGVLLVDIIRGLVQGSTCNHSSIKICTKGIRLRTISILFWLIF